MKISVQQYAISLYDSLVGKTEKEVRVILKNFVAILGRNRSLNKAEEIIDAFLALWNQEHGELSAQVTSARALGPTARSLVIDYLKDKTSAQKIILQEELDHKLIGGFVLRYGSKVVDGSLKNSLAELGHKLGN